MQQYSDWYVFLGSCVVTASASHNGPVSYTRSLQYLISFEGLAARGESEHARHYMVLEWRRSGTRCLVSGCTSLSSRSPSCPDRSKQHLHSSFLHQLHKRLSQQTQRRVLRQPASPGSGGTLRGGGGNTKLVSVLSMHTYLTNARLAITSA